MKGLLNVTAEELILKCYDEVDRAALAAVIDTNSACLVDTCRDILAANPDEEGLPRKMGAYRIVRYLWDNNGYRILLGSGDSLVSMANALAGNLSELEDVRLGHPASELAKEICMSMPREYQDKISL